MDRSLLERMTGATVLVILLVVLAPALLDGRQSPGSEATSANNDVMPAPQQNAPLRVATIRLTDSAAEPAAAAAKASPAAKPAPVSKPASPAAPVKAPSSPAVKAPEAGQWMVQLGSFSAQNNANDYAREVKAAGFPATVSSFRSGGKTMYRVQVGPRETRDAADKLVIDLKKAGYEKGLVMPVT
jgi:DedD protein